MQGYAGSALVVPSPPLPAPINVAPAAAQGLTGPVMSAARDLYFAAPDRKKAHLSKGRSETAAIVQFAIDLLGDPLLQSVSKEDWNTLELALP